MSLFNYFAGASFAEALGMTVSTKSKKKLTPIKDAYSPNNSGSTDVSFYIFVLKRLASGSHISF